MRHRQLGPTGRAVSVIGQGTWKMEADDRAAALASLRRGLDAGMNHIDTAELYGEGRVEESSARRSPAGATRSSWSAR